MIMTLNSCKQKAKVSENPLSSVIKLFSAEEDKNFDEAIKFIDVDRVYSDCKQDKKTPMECWKEGINLSYNMGQTSKFTNRFKYHDYKISESINGEKAKVEFAPIKKESGMKTMVLELEFINGNWMVVKVNHF